MVDVDENQYSDTNTKLFQKGRWYLFLDSYQFAPGLGAATAHRCKPSLKLTYERDDIWGDRWENMKSHFTTCLVVKDGKCQDCGAPYPKAIETLKALYNWDLRGSND